MNRLGSGGEVVHGHPGGGPGGRGGPHGRSLRYRGDVDRFSLAVVRLRSWWLAGRSARCAPVAGDPAPQSYHPERGDSLLFHLGVYPVLFPDASGRPEAVVVH